MPKLHYRHPGYALHVPATALNPTPTTLSVTEFANGTALVTATRGSISQRRMQDAVEDRFGDRAGPVELAGSHWSALIKAPVALPVEDEQALQEVA
jgi:hypothetical protein